MDVRAKRLMDSVTQLSSPATIAHTSNPVVPSINLTTVPNPVKDILSSFPEITRPYLASIPVKHSVKHHLPTTGAPVHACARRLPPDRLANAKEEFQHMLDLGIIRSFSNCSSALYLFPKAF